MGLLTCFLQAHALEWDISLIPPALPSTASTSTSTLVKVFGQLLGYDTEVIDMYKEGTFRRQYLCGWYWRPDTAGMGGVGGYKRLYKGGDITQVPDAIKDNVPDYVKEKAHEMARQELQRCSEELNMTAAEAKGYGQLIMATQAQMASLLDLLEHLAVKEEERVWVKRQTDGELDDSRLTEGLTGEATVYKGCGMEKPELGRPQIKPKRIRFLFDLSASMYGGLLRLRTYS